MTDEYPDPGAEIEGLGLSWTPPILILIRRRRRWRWSALGMATAAGLGMAWVHWVGLFLAGGLVGLVSQTLGRAALAGVVLGVFSILVQILLLPGMNAGAFLALRPPVYVTVAVGIGAPVWGSLIRGVV